MSFIIIIIHPAGGVHYFTTLRSSCFVKYCSDLSLYASKDNTGFIHVVSITVT